ncbi:hypothetical protein BDY21DRAFT_281398 [Lineolata rhizophorae]|uniref:DNA replication complex GINS protein PSF3 n=1 Tax=Lineolata rhizophorae TaxID=578093 RepID=A0A6A6P8P6_9PEZI|nr:hypothetical protein BDY21DRAFT_281398 [Lineolata rhizophorae]
MDSYYDVDAILTDSQKVPCTFELSVPGLGFLDGNMGGDMKQGTKVELPLWLAEMLAVSIGHTKLMYSHSSASAAVPSFTSLDLPSALSNRVVAALKADPRTVDLRAQAPHFYALGARILELFDEDEIVDVLSETFKVRVTTLADQAHNPRGATGEGADFLRGLDETERKLFRDAHDGAKAVRTWLAESAKKK